jgi:hypothetical protein
MTKEQVLIDSQIICDSNVWFEYTGLVEEKNYIILKKER